MQRIKLYLWNELFISINKQTNYYLTDVNSSRLEYFIVLPSSRATNIIFFYVQLLPVFADHLAKWHTQKASKWSLMVSWKVKCLSRVILSNCAHCLMAACHNLHTCYWEQYQLSVKRLFCLGYLIILSL